MTDKVIETVSIQDLLSGRIRLEFGNQGQLKAIKAYEKKTEDELKRCEACDGNGSVICEACQGAGEKD